MSKIAPAEAPVTRPQVPPGRVIGPGRAPATFPEPAGPGETAAYVPENFW